ncbi:MAG: hypothetical protein EHM45_08100 [Desulfobacteraceae bacterium]|nr:MAG: hypothetical protein EHM45_08100 [Desulfobacteraceae bacterium]
MENIEKNRPIFGKKSNLEKASGSMALKIAHDPRVSKPYTVISKNEKRNLPSLSLFLFGRPRVKRNDLPIEINRRRALALAAYLALNQGPQNRDTLATLLWPENDQTAARTSLGTCLAQLRKLFGFEFLLNDREHVSIHPDLKLRVDVRQFQELIAGHEEHRHSEQDLCADCLVSLTRAVELYKGDFMAGFVIPDNDFFENWKRGQTEELRQSLIQVLRKLVLYHHSRKEFETGLAYARRWLKEDPLDEKAHFHLMRLYADSGQPSAALRQYQECVRVLKKELDIGPHEETVDLHTEIKKQRPAAVSPAMPVKSWSPEEEHPPAQPDFCIGREKEIKEINRLLADPQCRLLTLVGPGGVGKTQLAHKIHSNMQGLFRNGAFFVPLTHVKKMEIIPETIAYRLDLTFFSEIDRHAQVLRFLNGKHLLLILDNFEHLPNGAEWVADILRRTAGVKILVTSQQRLNLKEEWILTIAGLDYPPTELTAELEHYGAVQLYVERAKHVRPGFVLQAEDRSAISRICRTTGGLPLAIELAAGWLQMFSSREIAEEMEKDLGFLKGHWRDLPERHRSLEAVFERSLQLLTPNEQQALKKLAVFRGGFSRQAAKEVAGVSLPVLLSLIQKSFLKHRQPEHYELLDLLRKFVRSKAQFSSKEFADVRCRHAAYFGNWLQQKEPELKDGRQKKAIREITEYIQNIHKGWAWAVANKRTDFMKQYLEGLFYFYEMRGWYIQGEQDLQKTLEALQGDPQTGKDSESIIGKILSRQGRFCLFLDRYEKSQALLEKSVSIFRKLNLKKELGWALNYLGIVFRRTGRIEEAKADFAEALALFEETLDRCGIAAGLKNSGTTCILSAEYADARKALQRALNEYRARQDSYNIVGVLNNLAIVHEREENYAEAVILYRESLEMCADINDEYVKANYRNNLGFAYWGNGQFREAEECFRTAVKTAIDVQARFILQEGLIGLAHVLEKTNQKGKALEIIGFMLHTPPIIPEVLQRAEQMAGKLRRQFSEPEFATLIEKGKGLSLDYFTERFKQGLL